MILADLELDLDVFQGPFDLLLALVLREEVELADVPIAEIVVAYVERAYEKGELDLESASEFLVLMAAPDIDVSSGGRPLVPVERFLDHFRTILRTGRGFQFEEAVEGLDRLSQAAAFLALLEMIKRGEVVPEQPRLFAPIRVVAAP